MTGIYRGDGTSYHFDQDKYRIIFENMRILLILKKGFEHRNRPDKMVLDYATKTCDCFWKDGYHTTEPFSGVL
jgi:hypothetical protein